MKRIFIFSDTHDYITGCADVLRSGKADAVIHAGDHAHDAEELQREFPEIPFFCVKGNCDFFSSEPSEIVITQEGVRIFITHGHLYNVKYEHDYRTLRKKGVDSGASLIVFGHTHIPYLDTDGKTTIVNPGSAGYGGTYAIATLDQGKVRVDMASF